ncbi:hypothetical protein L1987_11463 [Smallanthus sonchifolius]|uniref:Uncharacterized protein n=1 Tax=Smallanthus sonchifolius TaxID=185202 RepID=A0ACB9JBY8_9ASTR|nr:hypothetical protein L1987_11463 [Smallanthus sonchifolius]
MRNHSPYLYSFLLLSYLMLSDCDTLYANQPIEDGKTIVSNQNLFELGFFSPGKSNNRYLAIWYKNISICTVVWVANRETPITDRSGVFKVSSNGNLEILSGGNTMVWSSNSTAFGRSNNPVVVQLLDTGNLVVWEMDKDNNANKNLIWQSFDHPGDTILPGMKFGKDLVTGLQRNMTSWKSPDDPSIGAYSNIVDTDGYPQIFGWQDQVLIARLGPWNGMGYSGIPIEKENPIYFMDFVVNEKEIYYTYELKSSVVQRVVLTSDGRSQILHWVERIQDWIVYGDYIVDNCDLFAVCGPYGSCNINKRPPCTCVPGFEPRYPKEWDASDWSSGCKRKMSLNCGDANGDGFLKITGIKVPDTRRSWYNASMTLGECEMACRMKCSCTAYANSDISNGGSGCLLCGYISPEYAVHGCFSIKSDVFSFGVLVLEILSGKKNREFSHEDYSGNLLGHAWRLYIEGNDTVLPSPKQPAFFTEENSTYKLDSVSRLDEYRITLTYPR